MSESASTYRSGVLFGLVAYLCWGLVPAYFHQLKGVDALEILAHRICWSILILAAIAVVTGSWRDIIRVIRTPRLLLILLLSAVLLTVNWLLYIYATVSGAVAEASLGYYMMPLVNAFLATVFLGEKLRPLHYPALGLVAVGVAVPFVVSGTFTWLAVAVPITFGFYGLVRKQVKVDSSTGLAVESLILVGPSLGFLLWQGFHGQGKFGPDPELNAWFAFGGLVTVVPLLTFTLSLRRLPLLANSFIQFLSPTMQLVVAVYWIGEVVPTERWIAIGFVWVAVAIFIGDAVWQVQSKRRSRKSPMSLPRFHQPQASVSRLP